ncbi:STAS domain-containing protein [Streptomyces sp. NPDC085614]|uniref:STAS domain-containing protein n=1 Tax=unclassified Streptomyces TaxID=2593676 RepID=UPI0016509BBC|nr:STAS domain-containing protein [Streptomyces sp. ms191]
MSTTSTAPILTSIPLPVVCDPGADTAPGVIAVQSCTSVGSTGLRVRLAGEVDHHSCAPLRAILASAAGTGVGELVLDVSRVTFCDSGLLAVLDQWTAMGGRYRIDEPPEVVLRLLRLAAGTLRPPPRPRRRTAGS